MTGGGYKKYMKKSAQRKDYSLVQLFVMSFFGMLLIFTFLIKSFSPSVDVSIGDYKQDADISENVASVDDRLSAIQDEDQGKNFSELMKKAEDIQPEPETYTQEKQDKYSISQSNEDKKAVSKNNEDTVYKVYIGSYTSAEQAKVAKDIIQDSGLNLNPIVKCVGSNNYTLQVGIFKNKSGAESLLTSIQQNHLPGRIIQED
jgi:hypothetical protein